LKRRAFLAAVPAVVVAAKYLPTATPGLDRYITANVWIASAQPLTEKGLRLCLEQMCLMNELRSQRLAARELFGPPRYFR
jgi:hypothetical protein